VTPPGNSDEAEMELNQDHRSNPALGPHHPRALGRPSGLHSRPQNPRCRRGRPRIYFPTRGDTITATAAAHRERADDDRSLGVFLFTERLGNPLILAAGPAVGARRWKLTLWRCFSVPEYLTERMSRTPVARSAKWWICPRNCPHQGQPLTALRFLVAPAPDLRSAVANVAADLCHG